MTIMSIISTIDCSACAMRHALALLAAFALLATPAAARPAQTQPAPAPAQAQPAPPAPPVTSAKGDTELLVPPQGGAVEVPIHAGTVCILSFPEAVTADALKSSPDFEAQRWGADGIAVRALHDKLPPATLALATVGGLKVNVTLQVVPASEPAFTLVRIKAVSAAEAFEAQVRAEVERRTAPIAQRLERARKELEALTEKAQKDLDVLIRDRTEGEMADRMLRRNEAVRLESHARNDDHVIVHVRRGYLFGEDGVIVFDLENRSGSAYRLASVRVLDAGRNRAGAARLASTAFARDPALVGVVAAGKTARGVVTVRSVTALLNRPLALELAMPDGRGVIRAEHGSSSDDERTGRAARHQRRARLGCAGANHARARG